MNTYKAGTIFIYGKKYNYEMLVYIELLIDLPIVAQWIKPVKILYSHNSPYDAYDAFYIHDVVLATEEEIKTLNKLITFQ